MVLNVFIIKYYLRTSEGFFHQHGCFLPSSIFLPSWRMLLKFLIRWLRNPVATWKALFRSKFWGYNFIFCLWSVSASTQIKDNQHLLQFFLKSVAQWFSTFIGLKSLSRLKKTNSEAPVKSKFAKSNCGSIFWRHPYRFIWHPRVPRHTGWEAQLESYHL